MTPQSILALDLALKCGWAEQLEDGSIVSGTYISISKVLTPGRRWKQFAKWLAYLPIPQLIVYEAPFIHPRNRRGWGVAYGFATLVELFGAQRRIPVHSVPPKVLKKWATGNGNADKATMMKFARSMGWKPADDNEADALWLLKFAQDVILKGKPHEHN